MAQYRLTSLRLAISMLTPADPAAPRPKASDVVKAAKTLRAFLTEGQAQVENGDPDAEAEQAE